MNYIAFKNKVKDLPVIFSRDLFSRKTRENQPMRNQLTRWCRKGLIIKLRRGAYILNEADRKINPGLKFIANQLYGPSYVSLEFALNLYALIPEKVVDITSVTTRKTMSIKNDLGVFIYQHIKPSAFRGFNALKEDYGFTVFIAEPEKAVVDFLYLNLGKIPADNTAIFRESYRFQNLERLSRARIMELSKLFNNPKLMKVAENFSNLLKGRA